MAERTNPALTIRRILKASPYNNPFIIAGWTAVSRLETGNWVKSPKLFGEYHNGFGMGVPSKRPTTRNGKMYDPISRMEYSTYSNFSDSVRDIVLWMQYTNFPKDVTSPFDFATQLKKRNYATDPQYLEKLLKLQGVDMPGGGKFRGVGYTGSW